MLFNSYVFLFCFLPTVLVVYYYFSTVSVKLAVVFLVAASLFYYSWWDVEFLALILFSIFFNYLAALRLQSRKAQPGVLRLILIVGIAVNLGLLGFYKYLGFFAGLLNAAGAGLSVPEILLPIGISFFTFQQIAFLADTYQGITRERDFKSYALFVTFFPQLIAGPIVHHSEMLPQFKERLGRMIDWRLLNVGVFLFVVGLSKKVWIADTLAVYADASFDAAATDVALTVAEAWAGALAYTFQLYFDFSGYSDMAAGLALMFGIRLPVNFFSPYRATNIIDFWRRWHITLSRFLRDYLYVPLGGNRKGPARRWFNLAVTMVLGGLWHGAALNFLIWGALHGGFLVVNHAWRRYVRRPFAGRLGRGLSWGATFAAVVVAWVYFRAVDLETAHAMLRTMFGMHGVSLSGRLESLFPFLARVDGIRFDGFFANGLVDWRWGALMIAAAGLLAVFGPNTVETARAYRPVLGLAHHGIVQSRLKWRPNLRWALVTGLLFGACMIKISGDSPFLYFQF